MDPYVEVCKQFADKGIRYVVVGVFGINLYAQQVGEIITTADCDILIPAEFPIFRKALQVLVAMDFTLEAGGEPLPTLDPLILKGVLRARAVVRADRADARIDLCTRIAGVRFSQLWESRREFILEGVRVYVGRLRQLIKSKKTANRPKDELFLEQHKETIELMLRRRMQGPQSQS
jgi:hypothetical protein